MGRRAGRLVKGSDVCLGHDEEEDWVPLLLWSRSDPATERGRESRGYSVPNYNLVEATRLILGSFKEDILITLLLKGYTLRILYPLPFADCFQ